RILPAVAVYIIPLMSSAVKTSVVLLLLSATRVAAQEPAVTGLCAKPDSVAFRGNARVSDAALRGDVGITAGSTLSYRALQRAIKSLYATAQFDDIQVHCEVANNNRAVLAFELRERPLLGDVEVRGADRVSPGTL